jgi:hypothetical protein
MMDTLFMFTACPGFPMMLGALVNYLTGGR